MIRSLQPDIVILDLVLPGLDGLSMMERVMKNCRKIPVFIVLTAVGSETATREALKEGADYYLLKPFDGKALRERIIKIADPEMADPAESRTDAPLSCRGVSDRLSDRLVTDLLKRFRIPPNLMGFEYLRTGLMLCIGDMGMLNSITKTLYPAIAEHCSSRSQRVERAIRHAIAHGWELADRKLEREYFGYCVSDRRKPSNSEFIAQLADHIRMELDFRK